MVTWRVPAHGTGDGRCVGSGAATEPSGTRRSRSGDREIVTVTCPVCGRTLDGETQNSDA